MFFQVLPRVDLQPRVLVSRSEPITVPSPNHQLVVQQPSQTIQQLPQTQTIIQQLPQPAKQQLSQSEEPIPTQYDLNLLAAPDGEVGKLIKAVQCRPALYISSVGNKFINTDKKVAWNEISKIVNYPVEVCQQKWKSLRDVYVKKKRLEEGDCPKGVAKKWPFMQAMSFIDPYLKNKRGWSPKTSEVNTFIPNGNLMSTENHSEIFILGTDSTQPFEENSNNESVNIKLEPLADDHSQEIFDEPAGHPLVESPSTSCEKEDSVVDPSSSLNEELILCHKRRSKKRKTVEDPEEILETAINKLLNEPAEPPEDYLDLRTKSLCLLIRSKNFNVDDQQEILKQCEDVVLKYKKRY